MLFNFRLFKSPGRRKHSFKSPPKMSSMVHFNPRADAWQYYGDVVFLAVSTFYFIRAITPPFKATKEERARAQGRDVLSRLGLTNIVLPVQVFAVCIALYTSKAILERGYVGQGAVVSRLMFWTGNALVTLGSMGRLACHRELGRFFTFDLAVTKGHKVIQSGPYAYVRHPAYTATLTLRTGTTLVHLLGSPAVPLLWKEVVMYVSAALSFVDVWLIYRRIDEEAMLQRELGPEYKQYMKSVPYRLIPGLL
ncbi:unnamed protein product [Jaminaea pallidilutea]